MLYLGPWGRCGGRCRTLLNLGPRRWSGCGTLLNLLLPLLLCLLPLRVHLLLPLCVELLPLHLHLLALRILLTKLLLCLQSLLLLYLLPLQVRLLHLQPLLLKLLPLCIWLLLLEALLILLLALHGCLLLHLQPLLIKLLPLSVRLLLHLQALLLSLLAPLLLVLQTPLLNLLPLQVVQAQVAQLLIVELLIVELLIAQPLLLRLLPELLLILHVPLFHLLALQIALLLHLQALLLLLVAQKLPVLLLGKGALLLQIQLVGLHCLTVHASPLKLLWPGELRRYRDIAFDDRVRGEEHLRPAVVGRKELLAIAFRLTPRGHLRSQRVKVRFARRGKLRGQGAALQPAGPAVIAGARVVDVGVVHHRDIALINVVIHHARLDMVAIPVVVKVVVLPIPALVADTDKAEAVVHAAVVAHVAAPIAMVPAVAVVMVAVAPPSGCPQRTGEGRGDPVARNVVVAGLRVVPVARCPQVIRSGCLGLLVDGQRRWRLLGFRRTWIEQFAVELVVAAVCGAVALPAVTSLTVVGLGRLPVVVKSLVARSVSLWRIGLLVVAFRGALRLIVVGRPGNAGVAAACADR